MRRKQCAGKGTSFRRIAFQGQRRQDACVPFFPLALRQSFSGLFLSLRKVAGVCAQECSLSCAQTVAFLRNVRLTFAQEKSVHVVLPHAAGRDVCRLVPWCLSVRGHKPMSAACRKFHRTALFRILVDGICWRETERYPAMAQDSEQKKGTRKGTLKSTVRPW